MDYAHMIGWKKATKRPQVARRTAKAAFPMTGNLTAVTGQTGAKTKDWRESEEGLISHATWSHATHAKLCRVCRGELAF